SIVFFSLFSLLLSLSLSLSFSLSFSLSLSLSMGSIPTHQHCLCAARVHQDQEGMQPLHTNTYTHAQGIIFLSISHTLTFSLSLFLSFSLSPPSLSLLLSFSD